MKPIKHLQHFIHSFFDPNRLVYGDKAQSRSETVPKGKEQVLTPEQIRQLLGQEPKKKNKKKPKKKKKKSAVPQKPKTAEAAEKKPATKAEKEKALKDKQKADVEKAKKQSDALKVQMMNEAVSKPEPAIEISEVQGTYEIYENILNEAYPFIHFRVNKTIFRKVYSKIMQFGLSYDHNLTTMNGWYNALEELLMMGEIKDDEIALLLPDYATVERNPVERKPEVKPKPKPKVDKPGDPSGLPEYAKDVTVLKPPPLNTSTIIGKRDTWEGVEGVFNHYYGNWWNLDNDNEIDDSPNWKGLSLAAGTSSWVLKDRMTKADKNRPIGNAYYLWLAAKEKQKTTKAEKDVVDAGTSVTADEKQAAADALTAADAVVKSTFADIKEKINTEKKDRIKELTDWAKEHDLPIGYTFLNGEKNKIDTSTAKTALKAKIASGYKENPKLICNILTDPNKKRIFTSFDKLYAGCKAGAFGKLDARLVESKFLKPEEDNTKNYKKMLEMFNAAIYLNNLDDFEKQDFLRA